jgi:hypothetical protein
MGIGILSDTVRTVLKRQRPSSGLFPTRPRGSRSPAKRHHRLSKFAHMSAIVAPSARLTPVADQIGGLAHPLGGRHQVVAHPARHHHVPRDDSRLPAFSRFTFNNVVGPDREPRGKPRLRGHDHRSFGQSFSAVGGHRAVDKGTSYRRPNSSED